MSTLKKKNSNTLEHKGSKQLDSFFTNQKTVLPSQDNVNVVVNNDVITRESVLNNLVQQKILYSYVDIKNKMDTLSENELLEFFKIIKNNNEKYSTNKNGIFINLSTLKKNTIQELSNFLYFCDNNNKAINEEEIAREKYKNMIIT